ncbi:MAG: hypothetical protein I3273_01570 [Candidatus Moeniiplasma glomeromycotorum]|nr:hypothetical protein [Candidatus Moeniiplasma glomeromycotorum]MCE8167189.1 hypothetical protein [Candidatus Moeniiplasma glomeromycotorum]MCE8168799.1 hypothetical protein [Candidatus Moeniiplasma glomeromycotorum]
MQKYKQQQIQQTVQITAHQKKLVFRNFYNTIESLEEYIEKTGYYPDFKNKKQIFKESINSPDRTPDELADDFLTFLFLFKSIINNKPEYLRKEVQEEYYKWINVVEIDVNNCPKKLKHFLFEINEILEGKGEKFVEQTRELINDGKEINPKDMLKVFGALQEPLNKNREEGKLLEGKTDKDIKIESRFSADAEEGEKTFQQISKEVSSDHDNFDYFFQSEQEMEEVDNNFQQARRNMIDNIKQHIDEWKIEEMITFNGHWYDYEKEEWIKYGDEKREVMLIHQSAKVEWNRYGGLEINSEKMLYKQRFSSEEWAGIERVLSGKEIMFNGETYEAAREKVQVSGEWMDIIRQEQQKLKDSNSREKILMQVGASGGGIIATITAFAIKGYLRKN